MKYRKVQEMTMSHLLRPALIAAGLMITLALPGFTAQADSRRNRDLTLQDNSETARTANVGAETAAIGLLGSAAWILGVHLRKKLAQTD